jgi:hypothetical protein
MTKKEKQINIERHLENIFSKNVLFEGHMVFALMINGSSNFMGKG